MLSRPWNLVLKDKDMEINNENEAVRLKRDGAYCNYEKGRLCR
jgi:hypothetical protein